MRIIAVVLLTWAATSATATMQSRSARFAQLDSRIKPPDPQLFASIRDAKGWNNPYLIVRPEGIEIVSSALPSGRKSVARADLRSALIELSVLAWPYGRVVAVQETQIRAADRRDERGIADNLAATLAVLESLQVTVHRWPS